VAGQAGLVAEKIALFACGKTLIPHFPHFLFTAMG